MLLGAVLRPCQTLPEIERERLEHGQLLEQGHSLGGVAKVLASVGILVDECLRIRALALDERVVILDPAQHIVLGTEIDKLYQLLVGKIGRRGHYPVQSAACLGAVCGAVGAQLEQFVEHTAVADAAVELGGGLHLAE